MRRYDWLACMAALVYPLGAQAQSAGIETSDYGDYFGDSRTKEGEGPRSLGEARSSGKAYRLGQSGSVYRKPTQELHTVHQGDTLWDLSDRYFGDPYHWPELWSYNPEITNPHWIYPLDQVRLTAASEDEQMAAAVAAAGGTPGAGAVFKEPRHGLATDLAPRVTVPAKLLAGDAIFLRDEGYLDDDELKESGKLLAASEEQMLLSDSDWVYVRFNKGQRVEVGQTYTVYRPVHKWERELGEHGKLVRIQGSVLINSFDPQKSVARATVVETIDPIERGMSVTFMERRFILEPPRANQSNVVAKIIGSTQPRQLLADGNVVFLNVGNDKGIVPGNRFFVVRQGDEWQEVMSGDAEQMGNIVPVPKYDKCELPKEVIAEMRVVKVRKKVTIAVITRTTTDVFQGEKVEMRVGY
jgi:hypothetical protein